MTRRCFACEDHAPGAATGSPGVLQACCQRAGFPECPVTVPLSSDSSGRTRRVPRTSRDRAWCASGADPAAMGRWHRTWQPQAEEPARCRLLGRYRPAPAPQRGRGAAWPGSGVRVRVALGFSRRLLVCATVLSLAAPSRIEVNKGMESATVAERHMCLSIPLFMIRVASS